MKADIHPQWFSDTKVICACGNNFTTGSTVPQIKVDICAMCHPIFTGQQKLVDTLGQVERFSKKVEISKVKQEQRRDIEQARLAKVEKKKEDKPSLRDLLMQARKSAAS